MELQLIQIQAVANDVGVVLYGLSKDGKVWAFIDGVWYPVSMNFSNSPYRGG